MTGAAHGRTKPRPQATGRRRAKACGADMELPHAILQLANSELLRREFLRHVSARLIDSARCDAVDIFLVEGGRLVRGRLMTKDVSGFSYEVLPWSSEQSDNRYRSANDDMAVFERACRKILTGTGRQASVPFRVSAPVGARGTRTHASTRRTTPRNGRPPQFPVPAPFGAAAVIPFAVRDQNHGLVVLLSKRRSLFSQASVDFHQRVVQTLGVAAVQRRAQLSLRERVKELTCLYGIARLVAEPERSVDKILQSVVELLPPAWLYPDIASGRIVLDEHEYVSNGFRPGVHQLRSEVAIAATKRGFVEVTYSDTMPLLDEGPFLREERHLIDTIAAEVALIVDRVQTEDKKQRLEEQLRHADRLATIGQLAAGVAHELNEPLGSILGFAQLAGKDQELPSAAREDLGRIVAASLHAREVIRKLMLFARETTPQKMRVDLNSVVDEGLYFLASRCEKAGIRLTRGLAAALPRIIADPGQLHQVLVNLVVNAIQATPDGGSITISTGSAEGSVYLRVEDTGSGMTDQVRRRIFTPFFTTKEVNEGTGLGLAVVHGIVTSHGGTIRVDSEVGKGTRFEVRLPVSHPAGHDDVTEGNNAEE